MVGGNPEAGTPIPERETFDQHVRDALNNLYDSVYLNDHPLGDILPMDDELGPVRRSQRLRRLLLEAIHRLRPATGVPFQSPDWRSYRILELRYIEGLGPTEVARRLSISRSQFFRDQAAVLDVLSDDLWHRWQLEQDAAETPASSPRADLIRSEAERLRAAADWQSVLIADLIAGVRDVLDQLAHVRGARIEYEVRDPKGTVHGDRVVMRQALINAISGVLEAVDCAQVALTARPAAPQLAIRVSSGDGSALGEPQPKSNLATARELMEAIGGGMVIVHEGELWEIRFTCPQGRRRCVLVVDDNQDVVDLFRRYLIGSPWTVRGARSASEARAVVLRSPPDAVILDVMMPHEDGWEFLDWLTGSAVGHDLPVLICSVLPEKTLALEMGAVAYLPKPVTQEMVLRALQQLV